MVKNIISKEIPFNNISFEIWGNPWSIANVLIPPDSKTDTHRQKRTISILKLPKSSVNVTLRSVTNSRILSSSSVTRFPITVWLWSYATARGGTCEHVHVCT